MGTHGRWHATRGLVLALGAAVLVACGGGGGGGDSPLDAGVDAGQAAPGRTEAPAVVDDGASEGASGAVALALLPGAGDAITAFADLQVDAGGVQHALMTDGELWVYYLRCASRCGATESWRALRLQKFEAGGTSYAVGKLQLEGDGTVHVAIMAGTSTVRPPATLYARCERDCLDADGWSVSLARLHGDSFLSFRVAETDWFALGADGLPRIVTLEKRRGVETDGTLTWTACLRLPCDEDDWTGTALLSLDRARSRPAEIVVARDGATHVAVPYQVLGDDRVQVVYLVCERGCDAASPRFAEPISLGSYTSRDDEQERFRLSLDPEDRPQFTLLDHEPGRDDLVHLACTGDCSSFDGWRTADLRPAIEAAGLAFLPGRGLDAATVDGELRVALALAVEGDRLAGVLVELACGDGCGGDGAWSARALGDTLGLDVPDRGGCVYVGTEIAPPVRLSGPAATFTLTPTFYCNFVPDDDRLPDASDIRTLPAASILQVR